MNTEYMNYRLELEKIFEYAKKDKWFDRFIDAFNFLKTKDLSEKEKVVCSGILGAEMMNACFQFFEVEDEDEDTISLLAESAIRYFFDIGDNSPIRIANIEDMLYPQLSYRVHTFSQKELDYLKEEATLRLLGSNLRNVDHDVICHWQKLANGEFPDGVKKSDEW